MTESRAVQTRNQARQCAYFMIQREPQMAAGQGGWAESTGVALRLCSRLMRLTILFAAHRTFRRYWVNQSTTCAKASLIRESQMPWAIWQASFWGRCSKVPWKNA
jgi:hypothetical protein